MLTPYTRLLYRVGAEKCDKRIAGFAIESGEIEGEKVKQKDYQALLLCLQAETITEEKLLEVHAKYAEHSDLQEHERGAYRTIQVRVGRYTPPPASEVQKLMDDWLLWYGSALNDSFRSHCQFEQIHPFVDFNGRMGRALWLRKAIGEGYDVSLGFLHKFYYQTLTNFR